MSYKIGEFWLLVEGGTKETIVFVFLLVVLVLHSYESIGLICRRFLSCILKGKGSRITKDFLLYYKFKSSGLIMHVSILFYFSVNVDYM